MFAPVSSVIKTSPTIFSRRIISALAVSMLGVSELLASPEHAVIKSMLKHSKVLIIILLLILFIIINSVSLVSCISN